MSCPIANPGPQLSPAVSRRRLSGSELLLSDGLKLRMRDLRREDQQRLKAFLERCSAGSIRARFFGTIKELSNALMDQLVEVDGQKRMALVVTRGEADNE